MTKNQETIDEIMRLRESGMKVQEIADHYGVSKERIYQIAGTELKAWQAEHAPPPVPKPKRKPDIRTIRKMLQDGKSIEYIAKHYKCNKATIYAKVRDDEARKMSLEESTQALFAVRNANISSTDIIDPQTGFAVENNRLNNEIISRMGDEKVTAFVQYHIDMLAMRQGVDKQDVNDLYNRFIRYLQYCQVHGIVPNNMNCYLAIGVTAQDISSWRYGKRGTPEHKRFADDISMFFASVHEQGATDGVLNPISAMFWQKSHDHLVEANKLESIPDEPLGEKRRAEDIAKAYTEVELPD